MESEEETQVGVVFAKIVVLSFLSRERQTNTLSTLPLQMFVLHSVTILFFCTSKASGLKRYLHTSMCI